MGSAPASASIAARGISSVDGAYGIGGLTLNSLTSMPYSSRSPKNTVISLAGGLILRTKSRISAVVCHVSFYF